MVRTKIFINNNPVDLMEDVSMPITYCINDIREPDKKSGSFSKTITIPGTAANNKIFSHIWNVATVLNVSGTTTQWSPNYNPNLKASALLLYDNQIILQGSVQLLNVNIDTFNNYKVSYDICIFAELNDLIESIGDKLMSQLDLSEYDHVYNYTNQVNSWATSVIKNGSPYVNFSGGKPTGEGYVYPMIDYGYNNGNTYNVDEFFPAIYAKTIFDKICASAGFQVAGQFINSEYFKRLVIPFGGGTCRLGNTDIENRSVKASSTTVQNFKHDLNNIGSGYPQGDRIKYQDDSTGTNYDTGNNWNTSLFEYTVPKSGTYKIETNINFDLTHYPKNSTVSTSGLYIYNNFCAFKIRQQQGNNSWQVNTTTCDLMLNPTSYPSNNGRFHIDARQATITSGTTTGDSNITLSNQIYCTAGDKLYLEFMSSVYAGWNFSTDNNGCYNAQDIYGEWKLNSGCSANTNCGWTSINLKQGSIVKVYLADTKVREGDTVSINTLMPDNIKQKDFILSILKMHNLYVLGDKTVKNKLIIDDRNSFYSSGVTRYWDTKLDLSKERKIIPMGELDARVYLFTYKDDSDYYNDRYKKKWNETYAQARYSITNDFLKNDVKTELIFSATPMADYLTGIDRIIPQIYTVDSNNLPQPKSSNMRILYYSGIKTTTSQWGYAATSGTTYYNTFPYAGFLDDPTNSTVSLDWLRPHEVYWTTLNYTDNNLINRYWKQALDEQTDPDSKIFSGYFKLTSEDMAKLDFRDNFYFLNEVWRLNKIYDYDPAKSDVTKCEFIKLKAYPSFVTKNPTGFGGINDPNIPMSSQRTFQNNNTPGAIGSSNYIATTSALTCRIFGGSNNSIGENCRNVMLINTSGVSVFGGRENITAINTTGTTLSDSNSILIGNAVIGSKIITVNTSYGVSFSEDVILVDATTAPDTGFNIYLPNTGGYNGYKVQIKKIDSSANAVVLSANGTIDGASTYSLTTQNYSVTCCYIDGNWYILNYYH